MNRYTGNRPEFREKLIQPLNILLERLKSRRPTQTAAREGEQAGTSIPSLFIPTLNMEPLMDDSDEEVVTSPNTSHASSQNDFQSSTLRYITDVNYLNHPDNQGLSDYTIHSSCHSDGEYGDGDTTHVSEMFSQDMFLTPQPRHKKRSRVRHAVHNALKKTKSPGNYDPDHWQQRLKRAYEHYAVYSQDVCSPRHRSYEWLLEVISSCIGCPSQDLHKICKEIEMVYFDGDIEHLWLSRTTLRKKTSTKAVGPFLFKKASVAKKRKRQEGDNSGSGSES